MLDRLGARFAADASVRVLAHDLDQPLPASLGTFDAIGVALGVAAAYILVFVRMSIPTERSHLIEYGVVALFIHEALNERTSRGRRVPAPALLAVLATGLVGVLDECIQLLLPSRVFDPVDMLFNVLAAGMAVTASIALSWARSRRRGSRSTGD